MNLEASLPRFFPGMELRFSESMKAHTTFRIGGSADAFCVPGGAEEFCRLIEFADNESLSWFILGGGANLLVSDRGMRGLVIATSGLSAYSSTEDSNDEVRILKVQAGLPIARLADLAASEGWSGLEFAASLPGSVGGAVFMNARCYGREIADALVRVSYFDTRRGILGSLDIVREDWAYKRTPFMPGAGLETCIILEAEFRLVKRDAKEIRAEMDGYTKDRVGKGHFDYPSAGSMFKNNHDYGRPTGAILDELGFRGRRIGDAMVSPKHANIFVNAGNATADDMRKLVEEAQGSAHKAFGFKLEPEVVFTGD